MDLDNKPKARVLAYYLPQYHPIPENDRWWGTGFTEWTNVGKAKPLFPGHYQPHLPADLGYYDLRVPEVREAQADMARKYGVEGFIYWHYWFGNGKRLLERPFNEVLMSGKPDFPFALAWANETWKGFAFGVNDERNVLIEQTYPSKEDFIDHFKTILPAFKDKRYITCENKPIFIIYQSSNIPNVEEFIALWNDLAKSNGLKGIYFIAHEMEKQTEEEVSYYHNLRIKQGFSAVNFVNTIINHRKMPFIYKLMRNLLYKNSKIRLVPDIRPYVTSIFSTHLDSEEDVIPTIMPNWDHTPRTGKKGVVVIGATPDKFNSVLKKIVLNVKCKKYDKRFIFIKSWNEWAEGNYMEPDRLWGTKYLEALAREIL